MKRMHWHLLTAGLIASLTVAGCGSSTDDAATAPPDTVTTSEASSSGASDATSPSSEVESTDAVTSTASSDATEVDYAGKSVCIDQYATATVIDDLINGIKETLQPAVDAGLAIDVQNPNADPATEQIIIQKFISSKCDVIVPVGTAAAELAAHAVRDIPIVFAASSTPVEAKLVASMEAPGGNVTGVADVIDPATDAKVMNELIPDLKKVGLVWKIGDPAGDALCKQFTDAFEALGVEVMTGTIRTGSDVTQATQSLVSRGAQAVGGVCDTTTISAVGGIIKVADEAKIPVFGGTTDAVEMGGVEAQSYDYVLVGNDVGTMVLDVLGGADPASTPVVIPETGGIDLNVTKLGELGFTVPDSIKAAAIRTF